jgi:integrase
MKSFDIRVEKTDNKVLLKVIIDGKEFALGVKMKSLVDGLEEWLQNVHYSLKERNNNKLSRLIGGNIVFRFLCMSTLFPTELKHHVQSICDLFVKHKIHVTPSRVVKYIILNDIDKSIKNHSNNEEIISIFRPIIEEYKKKSLNELFESCERNDKETVWRLCSAFEPNEIIEALKTNENLYKKFEKYIKSCGDELKKDFKPYGKGNLFSYAFEGIKEDNHTYRLYLNEFPIIEEVGVDIYNSIIESKKTYNFRDDLWVLSSKNIQGVKVQRIDFKALNGTIKIEVKKYINSLLENPMYKSKQVAHNALSLITVLSEFHNLPYKNINTLLDINYLHVTHLLTHMQQITNKREKKYSYGTIRLFFSQLRLIVDYLIEQQNIDLDNPFRKYKFKNANSFRDGVSYIPETVVTQLQDSLHKTPEDVQNAWTIMMNTGMRVSDLLSLEEDCIHFDEKIKMHVLQYVVVKTEQKMVNKGLQRYHKIPVNNVVVEAIQKQKEHTLNLRLLGNSKWIFITHNGYAVVSYRPDVITGHINKLCKSDNIKDVSGEIFHYTNQMCRKTLVTDMITNGATIEQIADYIGQMDKTTTEKYYRDVENKKIAELDNNMWNELFENSLSSEIKEQYTNDERDSLFREIKLGTRLTPEGHGFCAKHVSFGPCRKKKCVGCRMLITGPQKLPMWYKLYKEQQVYLDEMEHEYVLANVTDYKDYRLYQEQLGLLDIYRNTIDNLEKFSLQKGISFEKHIE